MKLFSSTQISWNEPYFFVIRLREPSGWARRGLLGLLIVVVMFVALFFTRPNLAIINAIGISLMCGVVLVVLLDVGNIQREVTINDDSIIYHSAVGESWMGSIRLPDILRVELVRPEDWKKPYGGMLIQTASDGFLLGVPNKTSLTTVADVLHRLGVNVELQGWEPSETDTRVQVKDEVVVREGAANLSRKARIWAVEPSEGRLTPPVAVAVSLILALGPLLASLLGLISAGIYIVMKWSVLDLFSKLAIGGGAFAALVLSFVYLVLIGQPLASRYAIGAAKGMLRTRPNSLFPIWDPELIAIDVFDRSAWTSTIVKSIDDGFLRIEEGERCLKFEGNKNRWDIPTAALTTCRIEEAAVGSEGNPNPEVRYYVVIACDRDGEPWEVGMIISRTEFGSDGKEQKYARSQRLFERISKLVATA